MKLKLNIFVRFPLQKNGTGSPLTHLTSKDIDLWIVERAFLQLSSVVVAETILCLDSISHVDQ